MELVEPSLQGMEASRNGSLVGPSGEEQRITCNAQHKGLQETSLRWGKEEAVWSFFSDKAGAFLDPFSKVRTQPEVRPFSFPLHRTSSARRPQHRHLCESGSSRGHWSWDLRKKRSGREGMEGSEISCLTGSFKLR